MCFSSLINFAHKMLFNLCVGTYAYFNHIAYRADCIRATALEEETLIGYVIQSDLTAKWIILPRQ